MFRKLILALALGCAGMLLAEYQVYQYKATIKRADIIPGKKADAEGLIQPIGARTTTDTLTGYLVTVACYPCGASMGKGYESWLFVVSKKAGSNIVWRLPVALDGGLFGPTATPANLSEAAQYAPTSADKALMRRATAAWLHFEADAKTMRLPDGRGLFGPLAVRGRLVHDGYGTGAVKINAKATDPGVAFNPYIKSITGGAISGWLSIGDELAYGFDPSSRRGEYAAPVTGSFAVKFNAALTDEIRGTADWNEIARRVLTHFRYATLRQEPYDETLMWELWPPFGPAD